MADQNAEYVQRLEWAVNLLWGWMPGHEVKEIVTNVPELAELCRTVHRKVDHGTLGGDEEGEVVVSCGHPNNHVHRHTPNDGSDG